MRLHYALNTISIVAAITLEEAGLDYKAVRVDFAEAEQTKAPYLTINSKGRVPALEAEGTILTETGAILDYIAATAPQAGLIPSDNMAAAKMRSVMYYLASTMHVNHAHKMRGTRWATQQSSFDDMAAKVPDTMTASCKFIEEECLHGPYVLGDAISLADPYLFMVTYWAPGDGVDMSQFPKLSAFMATMESRASVKSMREKRMLT